MAKIHIMCRGDHNGVKFAEGMYFILHDHLMHYEVTVIVHMICGMC